MQRRVLDDVELVVARDHPLLLAADIKLEDRGEEVAGIDELVCRLGVERNRLGGLAAPVNHCRYAAFTAYAAGGPLACPTANRGRELLDRRHVRWSSCVLPGPCARGSRPCLQGCWVWAGGGCIGGNAGGGKRVGECRILREAAFVVP